jgi:hypothetical protein
VRTLQLVMLALVATAARSESLNVNARLNCDGAFDMTLQEATFLYLVDSPFGNRDCPDASIAALGDPVSFSWEHSILPLFPPLDYSLLLPTPLSPSLPVTIEGLFKVQVDLETPTETFPGGEFFGGVPITWQTEGKVCYSDPAFPCVDFSESGKGTGRFFFFLRPDGLYHLDFGAVSSIPEPSSLLLLATAVGIAGLVSGRRRPA